ncbi:Ppx/GppA phosphatase family protein [Spirochaeta africana]|uniref:Exopolyphosphatase n=1 Tax=Spirochaeta africana (strain ATCC 700263 / DSM 8902 / Z-7692) TaxID=889378 RepID=H9UMU8_SPIAZ|nr:Ppx/GppA phosphatase family protein [Spirochaeta africana]AFG38841.1 exopolyphosphatase [Spirochaeta africana DSM 8902]
MNKPRVVAVIDIGSTAIRILVSEVHGDGGTIRRIDRAARPVPLGRDVFVHGEISRESMLQSIRILENFVELAKGYGLKKSDLRVIATSAVREARNRDIFIDRVWIKTGLKINIVEGVEENYLTYIAVDHAIRTIRPQFARFNSLILEVGGGTTEVMLLKRGRMVAAHSLRLGTVRLEEQVRTGIDSPNHLDDYIRENLRINLELLDTELPLSRIKFFVAVGGDARMAASFIPSTKRHDQFSIIERGDFETFVMRAQSYSMEKIVRRFGITYNEAEGFVPALLVCKYFLQATSSDNLIIPDVSLREGVLMNLITGKSHKAEDQFHRQVRASAESLGRKFHYDAEHARHVTRLALQLFDELRDDHGMDDQARLLLEVAAVLHDIGYFIRGSGHHKHGQYLVANSEIFGLSRQDIRVVSNVVRYHRKSVPASSHSAYNALRTTQRMLVQKLAAILRIADGLDRGHARRVSAVQAELREADLVIHCSFTGDMSVEKNGALDKADLFENVFGYRVLIQ